MNTIKLISTDPTIALFLSDGTPVTHYEISRLLGPVRQSVINEFFTENIKDKDRSK